MALVHEGHPVLRQVKRANGEVTPHGEGDVTLDPLELLRASGEDEAITQTELEAGLRGDLPEVWNRGVGILLLGIDADMEGSLGVGADSRRLGGEEGAPQVQWGSTKTKTKKQSKTHCELVSADETPKKREKSPKKELLGERGDGDHDVANEVIGGEAVLVQHLEGEEDAVLVREDVELDKHKNIEIEVKHKREKRIRIGYGFIPGGIQVLGNSLGLPGCLPNLRQRQRKRERERDREWLG